MFFIRMAARNILRQKRRSILTALSIMGSFILCSMAIGLVYGTYGKVIDTFTRGHSGHIQIHHQGYLERPSLYKRIDDTSDVVARLEKSPEVRGVSPRIIASVLISIGEKSTGARVFGVNPEREAKTTTIFQRVEKGEALNNESEYEIVISHAMAKVLGVTPGQEVILMTQAADGSMANDLFIVKGILNESSDAMESRNIYMPLEVASEFFVLGNRVHEIAIAIDHHEDAEEVASEIGQMFPKLDVSPWQVIEAEFYKAMTADQTGIWINLGIMLFIVSIGVLNTVLMTILERTKEFGIMKAIGTRPTDIFILVVLETSVIAVISVLIGSVFALAINYKLSQMGIPYPMPIEIGGMALHHLYGQVAFFNLWIPAIVVCLSSVGVSIIPAIRAAHIVPVKAIRST